VLFVGFFASPGVGMAQQIEPDFEGKEVAVMIGCPDKPRWWTLEEPRLERQHGRLFLVGRMTDIEPGKAWWGKNRIAFIPWDTILAYCTRGFADRQQQHFGGPECNTVPG
jgi:hypothetical protein